MKSDTTFQTVQSKLIFGFAILSAAAAISLSFHQSGNAKNTQVAANYLPVQEVVIEAKRMTPEEKMVYDVAPQEVARVEIIGKRLSVSEKLAMLAEDEMNAKHVAEHRKV